MKNAKTRATAFENAVFIIGVFLGTVVAGSYINNYEVALFVALAVLVPMVYSEVLQAPFSYLLGFIWYGGVGIILNMLFIDTVGKSTFSAVHQLMYALLGIFAGGIGLLFSTYVLALMGLALTAFFEICFGKNFGYEKLSQFFENHIVRKGAGA